MPLKMVLNVEKSMTANSKFLASFSEGAETIGQSTRTRNLMAISAHWSSNSFDFNLNSLLGSNEKLENFSQSRGEFAETFRGYGQRGQTTSLLHHSAKWSPGGK
jgi:hypothetical protein